MKTLHLIALMCLCSIVIGQDFDFKRLEEAYNQLKSENSSDAQKEYLDAFPGSFEAFLCVFGYEDNQPAPLYFKATEYVPLIFKLDKLQVEETINKWISVSIGGSWQADAVNYFQHGLRPNIINQTELTYSTLRKYSDENIESFFYFFFSEPFPSETIPEEFSIYESNDSEYYACIIKGHRQALKQSKK